MGECNYYLKARFATAKQAKAALPRLTALLAEGDRAYLYWQDSRSRDGDLPRDQQSGPAAAQRAVQFWAGFRQQFPLVCQYLGELCGIADWDDGLVGQLGALVDPRTGGRGEPRAELVCRRDALLLSLYGIWHFSEMQLLEEFCTAHLGAVGAGSVSEEQFDEEPDEPFDYIDV